MGNIIVASIYLCLTILFACRKDDDQQQPPPVAKDCQIISQSGFIVADNEYGVGFRTKYSPDGKFEKVIAAILGHYSCVDTVRYLFTYIDDKNIHVTRASKNTCSEVPINIEDITASDSFAITLNAMGYMEKVLEYNVLLLLMTAPCRQLSVSTMTKRIGWNRYCMRGIIPDLDLSTMKKKTSPKFRTPEIPCLSMSTIHTIIREKQIINYILQPARRIRNIITLHKSWGGCRCSTKTYAQLNGYTGVAGHFRKNL